MKSKNTSHDSSDQNAENAKKGPGEKLLILQMLLGVAGNIFSTAVKAKFIKEKFAVMAGYLLIATFLSLTMWIFLMLAATFGLIYLGIGVIGALLIVTVFNMLLAVVFLLLFRKQRKSLSVGSVLHHIKNLLMHHH